MRQFMISDDGLSWRSASNSSTTNGSSSAAQRGAQVEAGRRRGHAHGGRRRRRPSLRSPGWLDGDSAVFTAGPGDPRRILFLEALVGKTLGAMSTKNPVQRFAQRLQYSVVRKTLTMLIVFVSGSLVGLNLKTKRSVVQRIVGDGHGHHAAERPLVRRAAARRRPPRRRVRRVQEHAFFRQAKSGTPSTC